VRKLKKASQRGKEVALYEAHLVVGCGGVGYGGNDGSHGMVAMAMPAFAAEDELGCRVSDKFTTAHLTVDPNTGRDNNEDGVLCAYITKNHTHVHDNHPNPS